MDDKVDIIAESMAEILDKGGDEALPDLLLEEIKTSIETHSLYDHTQIFAIMALCVSCLSQRSQSELVKDKNFKKNMKMITGILERLASDEPIKHKELLVKSGSGLLDYSKTVSDKAFVIQYNKQRQAEQDAVSLVFDMLGRHISKLWV